MSHSPCECLLPTLACSDPDLVGHQHQPTSPVPCFLDETSANFPLPTQLSTQRHFQILNTRKHLLRYQHQAVACSSAIFNRRGGRTDPIWIGDRRYAAHLGELGKWTPFPWLWFVDPPGPKPFMASTFNCMTRHVLAVSPYPRGSYGRILPRSARFKTRDRNFISTHHAISFRE